MSEPCRSDISRSTTTHRAGTFCDRVRGRRLGRRQRGRCPDVRASIDGVGDGEGARARTGENETVSTTDGTRRPGWRLLRLLDTIDAVDLLRIGIRRPGRQGHRAGRSLVDAVDGPLIAGRITSAGPDVGPGFRSGEQVSLIDWFWPMRDAAGRGPVLQIGMDTPQLTADLMAAVARGIVPPAGRRRCRAGDRTAGGGHWVCGTRRWPGHCSTCRCRPPTPAS